MHFKFKFVSQFLFPVTKVSLIGDFNGWSTDSNVLTQESENSWSTELDLETGSYCYKFMINDSVRINDPAVPIFTVNEYGEIASAVSIGEAGSVKPVMENNNLKLSEFRFAESFDIEDAKDENNGVYILGNDRNVICRLLLSGVNRKHVVNCFWYTPENSCFSVSENIIVSKENGNSVVRTLWFWLNLQDQKVYPGNWSLQIFIDGVMAYHDSFCIEAIKRAFSVPDICDIPLENNAEIQVDKPESSSYLLEDITFEEEYPDPILEDTHSSPEVYDMSIPFEAILNTDIDNGNYEDTQSESIEYKNMEVQVPDTIGVDLFDLTGVSDELPDFTAAPEQSSPASNENNDNKLMDSFETDIPIFDEELTPTEPKKDPEKKSKEEDDINVLNLFNDLDT